MSSSKSTFAPCCLLALLGLVGFSCASSGSSGGAASPDGDEAVDCTTLPKCGDKLECSGGAQCFKLKSCPGFRCTDVKLACRSDCAGADCLVLESQPMLLSCR